MKVIAGVGSNSDNFSNLRYSRQGGTAEHTDDGFDDVRTIKSIKKPYFQVEIY
jgi:hypothetical protein